MKRIVLTFLMMVVMLGCGSESTETQEAATSTETAPAAAASTDTAAATTATTGTNPDYSFAATASMANLYEIMASQLAEKNAVGAAYKQFATTMIQQHTQIGEQYKVIAQPQGLPMPTQLEGEFQTLYDQLTKLTGAAFDAEYKTQMVATHEKAVQLFSQEAGSGQDPALKAFATATLPIVEHHLQMARALP